MNTDDIPKMDHEALFRKRLRRSKFCEKHPYTFFLEGKCPQCEAEETVARWRTKRDQNLAKELERDRAFRKDLEVLKRRKVIRLGHMSESKEEEIAKRWPTGHEFTTRGGDIRRVISQKPSVTPNQAHGSPPDTCILLRIRTASTGTSRFVSVAQIKRSLRKGEWFDAE